MTTTTGPLSGFRIIDLTRMAPGPFCTMMFGDMGADVIRIEPPPSSRISKKGALPQKEEARNITWNPLTRNKRSIIMDLKEDKAREVFFHLCKNADVLVEGFRPGVVKRLGCDYETVRTVNEKIIYCSISGYGQTGPYKDLVGHDINYISIGGALGMIGSSDGTPTIPYNIIADFAAGGMHAAFSIVSALLHRERTGIGQSIDIAMSDGVAYLLAAAAGEHLRSGLVPTPGEMTLNGGVPFYNVFRCLDGKFISIGCIEGWFWENLCSAIGMDDFTKSQFDKENYKAIFESMKDQFLKKTRDQWWEELKMHEDIAVAPVLNMEEVLQDPHVGFREMIVNVGSFGGEMVKQIGIGPKFSKTPGSIRSLGKLPGSNTRDILLESGYSQTEIENLYQMEVIF